MDNVKQFKKNSITSLTYQVVVVISGLILPRYILKYFGSDVNGLISSMTQFLSIIVFLELGVGAVIRSALYKPLAQNNQKQVDGILATANKYFTNIARVLLIYVISLIFIFPYIVSSPFDFLGTAFLIFSMSISMFSQYYFGIVNQLLLSADQKNYVSVSIQIITVILNTVVSVFLITQGFSIQIVRFTTSIIYLIRPLYLYFYVKKNYNINYDAVADKKSIPQIWNGIAQHVAAVVLNSTDMVVLTIFSTLENVSIYAIYNMVVNGVRLIITSITSGMQSFFGNLLARNQVEQLKNYFSKIEWIIHTTVVYLFGITAVLINPFVMIYTQGVNDANYYAPLFSLMITLAQAVYCLRLPYNSIVLAAGHYRQTQNSAIIEALINIVVSVITVNQFGLVGIAIGTLVAMLYKTIYLVIYLSKNIVFRPIRGFLKHTLVDTIIFSIMFIISNALNFHPTDFISWILVAFIYGVGFLLLVLILNYIFYKEFTDIYLTKFFHIFRFRK